MTVPADPMTAPDDARSSAASPGDSAASQDASPGDSGASPAESALAPATAPAGLTAPAGRRYSPVLALAARRPIAVFMGVTAVVVFGFVSYGRLPLTLMPEISYPTLTIRTNYPTASPEVVEEEISKELEDRLGAVTDLVAKSSVSRSEQSEVLLEFAWGTDMAAATAEVREKLDRAALPVEAESPLLLRYDPSLEPMIRLAVTSTPGTAVTPGTPGAGPTGADTPSARAGRQERLLALRRIAEDEIKPALETLPGVASVAVLGGFANQVHLTVTERALRRYRLTLADLANALRQQNFERAAGVIAEGEREYLVRLTNRFPTLAAIRRLPIAPDVPLAAVATVRLTPKDPEIITRLDGRPSVELEIQKEASANLVTVARRVWRRLYGPAADEARARRGRNVARPARQVAVDPYAEAARQARERKASGRGKRGRGRGGRRERVAAVQAEIPILATLPETVDLRVISDQSFFIEDAVEEVKLATIIGGLLAVLVLFTFLREFGKTLIVAVAIPISVVATFAPMQVFSVSLNLMSLGGLALGIGMLVDNAIVVLESIARCRQEGDDRGSAAVRGVSEVQSAIIASTLTTVAVFLPVVFVQGVAGQIFHHQALTVVFSLLMSLLVALFLIPALAARSFRPGEPGELLAPALFSIPLGRIWRLPASRTGWQRLGMLARLPLWLVEAVAVTALEFFWRYVVLIPTFACLWIMRLVFGVLAIPGRWLLGRLVFRPFERVYGAVERGYPRLVRTALAHKGFVLGSAALLSAAAVALVPTLGSELIPKLRQGEFAIEITNPEGTPLAATDRLADALEAATQQPAIAPLIERFALVAGEARGGGGDRRRGENLARLSIELKRGTTPADEARVRQALRRAAAQTPALGRLEFTVPALFSLKTPIEVEVRGRDLGTLRRVGTRVEAVLGRVQNAGAPAFSDIRSNLRRGNPELRIRFDRETLRRYGLTPESAAAIVRAKVAGEVATDFAATDRKLDVFIELDPRDKRALSDLLDLALSDTLKLRDAVAGAGSFARVEGPAEIRRIGNQRAAVIAAQPVGLSLSDAQALVLATLADLEVPEGVELRVSGQTREMQTSFASLELALGLAVFLVYIVMASQFESLVQPFVILLTVPLALVGVVFTLALFGLPISVVVIIGLIMLAGIVVNNAIVLVDRINFRRAQGAAPVEAILDGCRVRLRPILITTLTTALGLVPLTGLLPVEQIFHALGLSSALGSGEGLEMRAPLAITVIAGLLFSTVLTLVVIPVVYALFTRAGRSARAATARVGGSGIGSALGDRSPLPSSEAGASCSAAAAMAVLDPHAATLLGALARAHAQPDAAAYAVPLPEVHPVGPVAVATRVIRHAQDTERRASRRSRATSADPPSPEQAPERVSERVPETMPERPSTTQAPHAPAGENSPPAPP